MDNFTYTCPVCGYPGLPESPYVYADKSVASFEICPCCGTEFGNDDHETSYKELRDKWVAGGAIWWSDSTPPPAEWNGRKQLNASGLDRFS